MKRSQLFVASLVVVAIVVSCSKSNEEDMTQTPGGTPNTTCDTANMSFVTNIKPILQSNCYSCHSNANFAISGAKLEDYADVKEHADDGMLIGTITHANGYPAMPQSGGKLSDCNINKIKAWVERGAPNN